MPHNFLPYLMLWTFDRMYIFFLPWLLLFYFYTRAWFYFRGGQKPRTCQKVPPKLAGKIWGQLMIYIASQVEADEGYLVILTYLLLLLIFYTSFALSFANLFTFWSSFAPEIQPCPREKSSMTIKSSINGVWCTRETIKNKGPQWRLVNLTKLQPRKAMQKN